MAPTRSTLGPASASRAPLRQEDASALADLGCALHLAGLAASPSRALLLPGLGGIRLERMAACLCACETCRHEVFPLCAGHSGGSPPCCAAGSSALVTVRWLLATGEAPSLAAPPLRAPSPPAARMEFSCLLRSRARISHMALARLVARSLFRSGSCEGRLWATAAGDICLLAWQLLGSTVRSIASCPVRTKMMCSTTSPC
mmetsp:Transcript_131879/g.358131  ORF Transcript_131879/g.358131 Transcript_131879/m.358131 type:complete len:201 (-) Transcript_131879:806-1408(-)